MDALRHSHLVGRYFLAVILLAHGLLGCGFHHSHRCYAGCGLLGCEALACGAASIGESADAGCRGCHEVVHPGCPCDHTMRHAEVSPRSSKTKSPHRPCTLCCEGDCVFARIDTQRVGDRVDLALQSIAFVAPVARAMSHCVPRELADGRVDQPWRWPDKCPRYLQQQVLLI